ncbi:MAG: hypothetical protein ABW106_14165 [Steroidobacteraceae bacterium]
MGTNQLSEVVSLFGTPEHSNAVPVFREKVRKWIKEAQDIEAQGALCSYILNRDHSSRVTPPLEFSDFHPFVSNYFLRCISEDPQGQWSDTRYGAGMALANWFKALKNDQTVPRRALLEIKESIQDLWDREDQSIRDGILNGTLEHIFEDRDARQLFDDWRQHPNYAGLYKAACEWQDKM